MTEKLSGREMAVRNIQQFKKWVDERDVAVDWPDYIRGNKLNRSEIAAECGFALSVIRQNPSVKSALETLEERLRANGTLPNQDKTRDKVARISSDATGQSEDRRIMAAKGKAEQRVKMLEEQNAALSAEVRALREQITRYRHLDEHLCNTGRMLRL